LLHGKRITPSTTLFFCSGAFPLSCPGPPLTRPSPPLSGSLCLPLECHYGLNVPPDQTPPCSTRHRLFSPSRELCLDGDSRRRLRSGSPSLPLVVLLSCPQDDPFSEFSFFSPLDQRPCCPPMGVLVKAGSPVPQFVLLTLSGSKAPFAWGLQGRCSVPVFWTPWK